MNENIIKVYAKVDENDVIISINSSIFLSDTSDYIIIASGYGDKFVHAQSNYLEKGLSDEQGRYNYKYIDNSLIELTEEEKQELFTQPTPEPTEQEKINAQLMLEIAMLKAGV